MVRGKEKARGGRRKDLSKQRKESVNDDDAENSGMDIEISQQDEMMDDLESNRRAENEGVMDESESNSEGAKIDGNKGQDDKTEKDEELLPRKKAPGRPKIMDPKQPHFCPFPNCTKFPTGTKKSRVHLYFIIC